MEQDLTLTPFQPLISDSLTDMKHAAYLNKQNYMPLYLIYSKGYRHCWNQQVLTFINALFSSLPSIIFRLYNLKCPVHSLPREVSTFMDPLLFFTQVDLSSSQLDRKSVV